jgi:hypothetical protein
MEKPQTAHRIAAGGILCVALATGIRSIGKSQQTEVQAAVNAS